ncbi:unnamed protein product [Auanema sp. JU1783]|nr:unnamed protein product [Auanema sp. JU1783]
MALEQVLQPNEYEIRVKDDCNLWDQLAEIQKKNGWTTQDLGTTSLLREMDTVTSLFIVRKKDNFLVGATVLIETEESVYANVYVLRDGYRASGLGMKLIIRFQQQLGPSLACKPLIARGAPAMMDKYKEEPFNGVHLYEMFYIKFQSKKEILDFFPIEGVCSYALLSVRNLNPKQFNAFIEYDKMITGVNREKFLRNYYSLAFVEGIVMFDLKGTIRGVAGSVPTNGGDYMYKINPVYAENSNDAAHLVHALVNQIPFDAAEFVTHIRTQSAGDCLLKRARDVNKPLGLVGVLCSATNLDQIYTDRSNSSLIFAPTNSPAHFDG